VSRGIRVDFLLFSPVILSLGREEGGCCDESIPLTRIRTKYLKDPLLYICLVLRTCYWVTGEELMLEQI